MIGSDVAIITTYIMEVLFMYEDIYQKIKEECIIRNLRPSTADVYFNQITVFLRWTNDKALEELTLTDARNYICHLRLDKHFSTGYCNGINSALRFFYKFILRQKWDADEVPRMVRERHLPKVLTVETIEKLIDTTTETRNKALIALMYSSGLRVGEVCRLAPTDIYMSTMQVHVRNGKNHCDRWTILSQTALDLLIEYWHQYPMKRDYLFVSLKSPYVPLKVSGVEIMLRKIGKAAGLGMISPHMLRHSFASHMVEQDVSTEMIQAMLGHRSPASTNLYMHVSNKSLMGIKSPLDHPAKKKKGRKKKNGN